jgi:hypothetical protein
MATKKECDRCAKQWDAGNSNETCAVAIDAPYWQNPPYVNILDRKEINNTWELCQHCTRIIYEVLTDKDSVVKST